MATASQGGRVAWIVPTYRNGRALWRWAENTTAGLRKLNLCRTNRSERLIDFANGGMFGIFSADSEDSIRGEAFHLAILDEAARIAESAWTDAIQPTLADFGGDAILISTPRGRNWFYREYMNAVDDQKMLMGWQAPSRDNPIETIREAADKARERVPERTYQQEWLAQFVEDGGLFRNVEACASVAKKETPGEHADHEFVMGVDWAKSHDWTVLTLICRECQRVVDWDRFNQIDYHVQRQRLQVMAERWKPRTILAEANSIGEPNIEELRRSGLPVRGFTTTAASKALVIEALSLALEKNDLQFPLDYAEEMRAFEIITRENGPAKYAAPDGMHDDRVMSLALAWNAATKSTVRMAIAQ